MLSSHALAEHAKRLSYKPGWLLSVYDDEFEGPHLFIVARVPNAYGGPLIELGIRSAIPPMDSLGQFERWVMWRVIRVESHEAREFLRRDGEVVFDPHREVPV